MFIYMCASPTALFSPLLKYCSTHISVSRVSVSHRVTERCSACCEHCLSATDYSDFTLQVLNAMHVRTFSRMTHHNHVHNYILASVLHKWQSHQTGQLEELKQRETVSLAGDMRADSTGHFAKYGSYSLMDLKTKLLISNLYR